MLKKLLKYDLKSIFGVWWIAALVSLTLCICAGACIAVLKVGRELPAIVNASSVLVIVFSVIGLVAFSLISILFIYVRYYKNFFTDEGYLTFTLPVKRTALLNSKLISAVLTYIITFLAIFINLLAMFSVGLGKELYTKENLEALVEVWNMLTHNFGIYLLIYAIEMLAIFILSAVFSILFVYCCITVASIIAKKAKVITAIGIYYGANMIFSFVVQIFTLFGMQGMIARLANITSENAYIIIAIVLFGAIVFMFVFCAMIYTLVHYLIDRKLNLA